MADYIPAPDDQFDDFQDELIDYIGEHRAELGVSEAEYTALTGLQTTWHTTYGTHKTAQTAAQTATTAKDAARDPLENTLRALAGRFQASPSITDAQRTAMHLPVRATTRTRVAAPTTKPVATIDTSRRLSHIIAYRDEAKPKSKAKPAGVAACEVWSKIGGPPPASPDELDYEGNETSSPKLVEHKPADAGKTAYYWLRWVNTRNEPGPWSDTYSATIPG
jgi:hypothetical protein